MAPRLPSGRKQWLWFFSPALVMVGAWGLGNILEQLRVGGGYIGLDAGLIGLFIGALLSLAVGVWMGWSGQSSPPAIWNDRLFASLAGTIIALFVNCAVAFPGCYLIGD